MFRSPDDFHILLLFESDNFHVTGIKNIQDDVEAEMRRLKLELKQTMDMYSKACSEALTAKQNVLTKTILLCTFSTLKDNS